MADTAHELVQKHRFRQAYELLCSMRPFLTHPGPGPTTAVADGRRSMEEEMAAPSEAVSMRTLKEMLVAQRFRLATIVLVLIVIVVAVALIFPSGFHFEALQEAFKGWKTPSVIKGGVRKGTGFVAATDFADQEDNLMTAGTNAHGPYRRMVGRPANSEPMLVPAFLLQLGELMVSFRPDTGPSPVLHAPAACCKIAVFRDMIDGDWTQFAKSPVKYVLARIPPLQVCQNATGCSCDKWHADQQDVVSDPVLDVWRRQWVSMTFKAVPSDQAEVYLFNMRCLESLQLRVLAYSGRHGIFIEPQTLDSRDPLLSYQVLWMPKTPHDELLRLQQCTPQIVGLARLGQRLGVRSTVEDASALAKLLKPGSIFLAAGAKLTFEVGPLPYGMDRLTVSRLCSQWNWQARPLHPSRSVDGALGNLWLVQACVDPPQTAVRYQGAEVVITKVPDKAIPLPATSAQVIGSSSTVKLCTKQSNSGTPSDPWLLHDPWSSTPPAVPAVDSQQALRAFESRIESKILAKIPAADMEVDSGGASEARFAALEQQVQALTHNHQALEAKIDESTVRADNQIAALQCQVSPQIDSQGQQIQALFATQMQQIEALLSKKHRTE